MMRPLALALVLLGCSCLVPVVDRPDGGDAGANDAGGNGGGAGGGVGGGSGGGGSTGGVGASCTDDAGCSGGLMCDHAAPRGYCTRRCADDCDAGICLCVDHGTGAICHDLCLQRCSDDGDCRLGYSCQQDAVAPDGGRGCWANNLRSTWDDESGQPCTNNCNADSCLPGNNNAGFCADTCGFPLDAGVCRAGLTCLRTELTASGTEFCAYGCETDSDCPPVFSCKVELGLNGMELDGGRRACTSRRP
jgi:hypothetical protein